MKSINLKSVSESTEGDFARLKPGAYACSIVKVEDVPEKEYLWVVVDIIAGEYKDFFSDPYYENKDWAHRLCFSYKETALSMLKGRLHCITDSNPGFDAEAAIFAGNDQMLVGKAIGVVFRAEEYFNKDEDDFKVGSPRPDRVCRISELDAANAREIKPKMLNEKERRAACGRAGVDYDAWKLKKELAADPTQGGGGKADAYDGEIPFM